ncbi:MAG: hypothetical protein CM15mP17_01110 [Gammaproteobacteria bacterium]|jgi:uncharacterized membrane protein YphA (DoxX/SURF4 family)|nr:MAG: hypothetical protein CM15mP17_01110 [Gammaproteobacteria bacterium]|tara:strand:- start:190 stop:606 length:417 start_codon:yes stop_codon:yes gene_type:complete
MNISAYLDNVAKPFMNFSPWLLRLSLGTSFILHGLGKFPMPADGMVKLFESKGILFPELTASLVALGEVGAGAAVIIGGFLGATGHLVTRLGGGAVAVIMIGALLIAHPDWLITQKLFMSEQIFLLALGTYFAIRGNN